MISLKLDIMFEKSCEYVGKQLGSPAFNAIPMYYLDVRVGERGKWQRAGKQGSREVRK
jgi:hypothetical protein